MANIERNQSTSLTADFADEGPASNFVDQQSFKASRTLRNNVLPESPQISCKLKIRERNTRWGGSRKKAETVAEEAQATQTSIEPGDTFHVIKRIGVRKELVKAIDSGTVEALVDKYQKLGIEKSTLLRWFQKYDPKNPNNKTADILINELHEDDQGRQPSQIAEIVAEMAQALSKRKLDHSFYSEHEHNRDQLDAWWMRYSGQIRPLIRRGDTPSEIATSIIENERYGGFNPNLLAEEDLT